MAAIVVMGVSGSGKSTVGGALARRLDLPFEDGDDLHPPANVAKMAAGRPLDDEDRWPWLDAVGEWLADHSADRGQAGGVVACSALKRSYRDRLREHLPSAFFLMLQADEALIATRLEARRDHFMPASLLHSQLETLEPLQPDEHGATVDVAGAVDQTVAAALRALGDAL